MTVWDSHGREAKGDGFIDSFLGSHPNKHGTIPKLRVDSLPCGAKYEGASSTAGDCMTRWHEQRPSVRSVQYDGL